MFVEENDLDLIQRKSMTEANSKVVLEKPKKKVKIELRATVINPYLVVTSEGDKLHRNKWEKIVDSEEDARRFLCGPAPHLRLADPPVRSMRRTFYP